MYFMHQTIAKRYDEIVLHGRNPKVPSDCCSLGHQGVKFLFKAHNSNSRRRYQLTCFGHQASDPLGFNVFLHPERALVEFSDKPYDRLRNIQHLISDIKCFFVCFFLHIEIGHMQMRSEFRACFCLGLNLHKTTV